MADFNWILSQVNANAMAVLGGTFGAYGEFLTVQATSGAAYAINYALSNTFKITLTANCTLSLSNMPISGVSASLTLFLVQDATGSRIVTWPATMHWIGGVAPTLATAAGSTNIITLASLDGGVNIVGLNVGSYT